MVDIRIEEMIEKVANYVEGFATPVVDLVAVQSGDPFKILVATILSARTRDEVTAAAAERLFKEAPEYLKLAKLPQQRIEKLIYPVGFFRNKAAYLSNLPKALEKFQGRVPSKVEDLMMLPGVGRKTATLVAAVAYKQDEICVDTHVHRIVNIWGCVETDTPFQTEKELKEILSRKYWAEINSVLVKFGQSVCRPVAPCCDICPINDPCPKIGVTPRRLPASKGAGGNPILKLISWNVNGLRAAAQKGFREIVRELDADIIAIQETKVNPDQLPEDLINLPGYESYWHVAERKGYSGVAVYTRSTPIQVLEGMGISEFDREGRVITLEFANFFLINVYFPNSGRKLERLDYKLKFNEAFLSFAKSLQRRKSVIICGDYNVAHKEIDLKNPAANIHHAGFTPEERRWMDSFLASGFEDTFRIFNKEGGNYTWWSYRFNARAKDIGWRIDYFCIDSESRERIEDSSILKDIMGSDHCPVEIRLLA